MQYANLLPTPNYKRTAYKTGDTTDIMDEVIQCYNNNHKQAEQLAKKLQTSSLQKTCNNIWDYIKTNISYKIDPEGFQWVRTPSRLIADGEGDCKSFSVLAASLLANLGITPTFRFTSYNGSKTPTHVYVVVKQKGKEDIIIDAVINGFNTQKKFTHKKDITMAKIATLSGTTIGYTPQQKKAAMDADLLIALRKKEAAKNSGFIKSSRNQLYIKHINSKLKQAGITQPISGTNYIAGGFFGNILGINAKLQKELETSLPDIAPSFLYLYIGGTLNGGNNSYASGTHGTPQSPIYGNTIVQAKREKAVQCFWDLRGQIDNISGDDLDNLIANAITEKIGISPKDYWQQFFDGKSNIGSTDDTLTPPLTANSNSTTKKDFDWKGLFGGNPMSNPGAAADMAGAAFGIPPGLLSGLVNGIMPSLQFRPALATFAPDKFKDFAGTRYANNSVTDPNNKGTDKLNSLEQQDVTKKLGIGAGIAALVALTTGKIF